FPLRDPTLEPFVLGETSDDVDVFHAVLIGLACVERLSLDYLDMISAPVGGTVTFTGGGTANRYWSQLRTNLLNRTARIPERAESAVGMAILAATTGGYSVAETVSTMVRSSEELAPEPNNSSALFEQYWHFVTQLHRAGHLDDEVTNHALRRQQ